MYTQTQWALFKTIAAEQSELAAIGEARRDNICNDDIRAMLERFNGGDKPPSKPQAETFIPTPTQESWAEQVIADALPEPKATWQEKQEAIAKEYRSTHRKQQVERQLLKAKMIAAVDLNMTAEFTVKIFTEAFPERGEKTIAELLVELWPEGKVKGRIDQKETNQRKNHSTCYYVITSLGYLSTNYYLQFPSENPWFKRPKK